VVREFYRFNEIPMGEGDVDENNNFTDLGNYGKRDYASPSQIRCTGDSVSYYDPRN